jgi:pantothenate synthetase
VLPRAPDAAEAAVAAGERDAALLARLLQSEIAKARRAEIDYAELCDPETLRGAPARLEGPVLVALAVFMRPASGAGRGVRLLDNRVLRPPPDA